VAMKLKEMSKNPLISLKYLIPEFLPSCSVPLLRFRPEGAGRSGCQGSWAKRMSKPWHYSLISQDAKIRFRQCGRLHHANPLVRLHLCAVLRFGATKMNLVPTICIHGSYKYNFGSYKYNPPFP